MSKYALVTGASRGIGREIAHMLAADGYHLYLTCIRSEKMLADYAAELSGRYNVSCTPFTGDMGNAQDVEALFSSIETLDVLINNAGVSYFGLLTEMTAKEWDYIINTNLSSAFYVCKCAVPSMLHDKCGKIINISSVWGSVGASMEVAYSASKGGLNAFTKALAKELAPSNIQVNAIACGVIDTDMNKRFSMEDIAMLKGEIPADRIGTIDEVARLVIQLINSPTYLTGQIIAMDGGWQ